jgi:hypothetical protein
MGPRFKLGILVSCLIVSELCARGEVPKDAYKTMPVVMCDEAALDARTFVDATITTAEIFEKAGIRVVWFQGCDLMPVLPSYFVVVVVRQPPPGWASGEAMGFAPVRTGDRRRAYVFLDRVKEFLEFVGHTELRPLTVGVALAHAIAHELGHLLLQGDAHTNRGIMNARWSYQEWQYAMMGNLSFLPDQAKKMRKELGSMHSQADSRVVGGGPD